MRNHESDLGVAIQTAERLRVQHNRDYVVKDNWDGGTNPYASHRYVILAVRENYPYRGTTVYVTNGGL